LARAVRERVQTLDPSLALYDLITLRDRLDATIAPRKTNLTLLGGFAALALLLTAVGIYGVMSFVVSQRTRELGIRIALGAQVRDVHRMVVNQGLRLVAVGLVAGLIVALFVTRSLASWLFGVGTADPATLVAVSLLLLLVGVTACWVPARRATRVDPMVALRSE
jgi:putative ABC transport system permease protein